MIRITGGNLSARRWAGWLATVSLALSALVGTIGLATTASAAGMSAAAGAAATASPPTITGIERQDKQSPLNTATAKSVTVTCPGTKKVINASGSIVAGLNDVLLDGIYPSKDLTSVTVTGKETDDAPANNPSWAVVAIAICADPPSGLQRYFASSPDDKTSPKTAWGFCPLDKAMLGTGMDIIGGQGQAWASAIIPGVDRTTGQVWGVTVNATADAANPPTGKWHVNAFAICADDVYQQQVLSADGEMVSDQGQLLLYCPFGTVATGTGYDTDPWDLGTNDIITSQIDPGGSSGAHGTVKSPPDRNFLETSQEDAKVSTFTLDRDYVICVKSG
jgi:hypothetical protein